MNELPGKDRPKLLVVGIDGATMDLVKPWADEGKLPTLRSLIDDGVSGTLESTMPPVTAPAWTSFMTGMNPGKHGIYDFLEPQANSYQLGYCSGRSRRAQTLWRLLSDAGLSVGVMNVPMTYPPEPVNGYIISGMDAPDQESDITYPAALKEELKRAVGGVQIDIRHLGNMRTDAKRDYTLQALEDLEDRRTRIALYLMEKHPTDIVMLYYNATDQVQHHFWHYFDPSHPLYDESGGQKYGNAIYRIYKAIDDRLAEILRCLSPGTPVVVLSDHGAGPVSVREVYLNRYLERLGLLVREPQSSSWSPAKGLELILPKLDASLRAVLTPAQKTKLAKWIPGGRGKFESLLTFWGIDWSRTRAYAAELSASSPSIWINLKGRQPNGTVEPGAEYEELIEEIKMRLLELKDQQTGESVIPAVYRKESVYRGGAMERAPDLILAWWEGKGFLAKPSYPCRPGAAVVARKQKLVPGADWSGNHRLWGIVLLRGNAFKKGYTICDARIIDIAPTLLALLGVPIPEDMDGRVLEDVFEGQFRQTVEWSYRQALDQIPVEDETAYSEEDAEKIRERLKGLGYIE